jgi:hypothetical protein
MQDEFHPVAGVEGEYKCVTDAKGKGEGGKQETERHSQVSTPTRQHRLIQNTAEAEKAFRAGSQRKATTTHSTM